MPVPVPAMMMGASPVAAPVMSGPLAPVMSGPLAPVMSGPLAPVVDGGLAVPFVCGRGRGTRQTGAGRDENARND
jgi:hypothetical protein